MTSTETIISFGPHAMCEHCFTFLAGYGTPPLRLAQEHRTYEECCRCGGQTMSGIYLRHDGTQLYHCPGHDD